MICKYIWILIYEEVEVCFLKGKNAKKYETKKANLPLSLSRIYYVF